MLRAASGMRVGFADLEGCPDVKSETRLVKLNGVGGKTAIRGEADAAELILPRRGEAVGVLY